MGWLIFIHEHIYVPSDYKQIPRNDHKCPFNRAYLKHTGWAVLFPSPCTSPQLEMSSLPSAGDSKLTSFLSSGREERQPWRLGC